MMQEQKLSRFLFHLRFSKRENYVSEHELYEVMKSRNLYQLQFGVRSNYQKTMHNIAKDERQTRYSFENNRKLFVQRMKERREQAYKLRNKTTEQLKNFSWIKEKPKTLKRVYVPIPQSTVVYSEDLPPIAEEHPMVNPPSEEDAGDDTASALPPAPSPSMVATEYSGEFSRKKHTRKETDQDSSEASKTDKNETETDQFKTERFLTVKTIVASRKSPTTLSKEVTVKTDTNITSNDDNRLTKEAEIACQESTKAKTTQSENELEMTTKMVKGIVQSSSISFSEDVPDFNFRNYDIILGESKTKLWAEKHGIVESREQLAKEADFQRLLIDRPSKWAIGHVHRNIIQSKILDMRLEKSKRLLHASFRKKSRQLDQLSEKLLLKQKLSLPELNDRQRPMVSLDPGGTTPDGRLILTKADYDDYLSGYRTARKVRLDRSKKRDQWLERQIEQFDLQTRLKLDEQPDRASLHTV